MREDKMKRIAVFAPERIIGGDMGQKMSPGRSPQPFSGHQNYLRKKIKKRIKRPCKVSVLLPMQGLFFVSNKASRG